MIEDFIPAGLRPKLLQSSLFPEVQTAARFFESFFRLSGTPFFNEYTDHSFQHSMDVFRTACDALADETLQVVSSEDLCVLVLACMLHDCGLHITEDIFVAITDQTNNSVQLNTLDSKTWPALWTEFVAEAKRFNAKKLISLFGDNAPVANHLAYLTI